MHACCYFQQKMLMLNFMIDKQIISFIIVLFFHRYFYVRTVLAD